MSDDTDADDTISVPLPEAEPELKQKLTDKEREQFERTMADLVDMRAAINTLERTLDVARVAFENLKILVFGDDKSIVHAWPLPDAEVMPCCGRKMMDVPLTERISVDGTDITCGKVET